MTHSLPASTVEVVEDGCFTDAIPVYTMEPAMGTFTLRTGPFEGAVFAECTVSELRRAPSVAEKCSSSLWSEDAADVASFTVSQAVGAVLPACSHESALWA